MYRPIRIKTVYWFVAALLLLPTAWLQAQEAPKTQTKHCLWKAQSKTNTIYLFGSIHFLKEDFYPLAKPIEDAYRQAQVLVVEADLDEMKSPKMMLKMLQMGKYPGEETLAKNISKETYAKLDAYLKEAGLPAQAFDPLRPWMVAVGLLGIELTKLGFNPEEGVDQYFYKAANRDKKTIFPLETTEFQLNLFTGFTKEEEEAMLKETLDEITTFKKILNEMTEAWKGGDTIKLESLVLDSMRAYPQLYKKLLVDRNQQWSEKIDKLIAQGKPAFVVVGAAHLVGKDNLVELLKKKGYSVEQK